MIRRKLEFLVQFINFRLYRYSFIIQKLLLIKNLCTKLTEFCNKIVMQLIIEHFKKFRM